MEPEENQTEQSTPTSIDDPGTGHDAPGGVDVAEAQATNDEAQPEPSRRASARRDGAAGPEREVPADPTPELRKLIELALKFPEIGPPLAELAFKIGQAELGNQIVRMGLEGQGPGLEYFFVSAHTARREQRFEDALKHALEAVQAFATTPPDQLAEDDGSRLLHLVRLGFTTLLFELKDVRANPEFVKGMAEELPKLEPRLEGDAFYHAMLAQTFWFDDRDRSEKAWEHAAQLGEPESTWNARGTWYKEAEGDWDKAEQAYRKGLAKVPTSALLMHNIAQLLVEKAGRGDIDVEDARRMLRDADKLLRSALRVEAPKGMRRHVHATIDRLNALRSSLPPRGGSAESVGNRAPEPDKEPEVGQVVRGRVVELTAFGAFISLRGRHIGLLHKSEVAHASVDDPSQVLKVGDDVDVKVIDVQRKEGTGKLRISLSRKALLPAPERVEPPPERPKPPQHQPRGRRDDRGARQGGGRDRERGGERRDGQRRQEGHGPRPDKPASPKDAKLASLGEMLLAKLEEQKAKKS